jgi:CRISPR-associated protein Cas5t
LVDLDVVVGARTTDETLLQRIENGLSGELNIERYGLPFAGDNNFLFDSIDVLREPCEAYWYEELQQVGAPRKGSCRLTTSIDRKNSSKTKLRLFAPTNAPQLNPPQAAWVSIPS